MHSGLRSNAQVEYVHIQFALLDLQSFLVNKIATFHCRNQSTVKQLKTNSPALLQS